MKRLINLVLLVVLFASLASAQTGVVTRNVNLRPDASTNNNPVEKVELEGPVTPVKMVRITSMQK